MSHTLKSEPNTAISTLVSGKDLNRPCCQLSLGKACYNFFDLKVLVHMKEILTEKPSSVVVVCLLQHIVYIQIE